MDENTRFEPGHTLPVLSVRRCVRLLLVGLLPVAGLLPCILWGYGPDVLPQQRALAKAMLCLHGAVLGLLLAGLGVWVLTLLARLH